MYWLRIVCRALSGRLHRHEADHVSAPTYDLGTLHGGLRLPGNKSASTNQSIVDIPIPDQLILPLRQHVGDPAQPVVAIGERVLKGQLIAERDGTLGAPVHASSSGTVIAIEPWPVVIRNGGASTVTEPSPGTGTSTNQSLAAARIM